MNIKELTQHKRTLPTLILLILMGGLAWWNPFNKPVGSTGGDKATSDKKDKIRPVTVTVAAVKRMDLPITQEAVGNVEALESVAVQPQISGSLTRVHFAQGDYVKKGQLLFELDSRLQSAQLAQLEAMLARSQAQVRQAKANLTKSSTLTSVAEANLKRDQAQKKFAEIELGRNKQLLEKDYVALQQYQIQQNNLQSAEATLVADQAAVVNARAQYQAEQAALQTALASVQADQAAIAAARVQLGFSKIYAPISGKTGPILITAGNNVIANNSTLVNIKKLSPILVNFSVPEKNLALFQQAFRQQIVPVSAEIKGKTSTQVEGRLSFVDNQVNKNTGMVALKASFENPSGQLWPGQFVPVSVRLGIQKQILTIPAEAVQKGPNGDFVYVMQADKAQMRAVDVERISLGIAVINKGLQAGENVIVTGLQSLAPDAPVKLPGESKDSVGETSGKTKSKKP